MDPFVLAIAEYAVDVTYLTIERDGKPSKIKTVRMSLESICAGTDRPPDKLFENSAINLINVPISEEPEE